MSVLETAPEREQTVLTPGPPPLPRVNLLPPEIAERKRFQRIQAGLGAGLLTAVAVVALLHLDAAGDVADAEDEHAAAAARGAALAEQTAEFADVEAVYARTAAAQDVLHRAMGQEVRFSEFLHDLSVTVPEDVWLQETTFTQDETATASGGIGTVSFTGAARSHDDVAVWLETLATQDGYTDPTFTGATAADVNGRRTVTFTSTVTLTADALSRRYTAPAGG